MEKIKVAIIGLGAIAEQYYLPLLKKYPKFKVAYLVDKDSTQLEKQKYQFPKAQFTTQFETIPSNALDGVIIATPNHTHFPIAKHFLKRGLPILVEKPLALKEAECLQLEAVREENNGKLLAGMVRRYQKVNQLIWYYFKSQYFGQLQSFSITEGNVFNWPIKSLASYDKAKSGGGVLMDNGIHSLDLVFWWLSATDLPSLNWFEYADDAQGGVEAECLAHLTFSNNLKGQFQFSRIRKLTPTFELNFEHGYIKFLNGTWLSSDMIIQRALNKAAKAKLKKAFQLQLKQFMTVIQQQSAHELDPVIPYTLKQIEGFYQNPDNLTSSYYHLTA